METKSKILFGFLALLITLSVSASYYRYMVLHDYVIEAETDCDPSLESCFVWVCNEEIDGECAGNEEEDTWYYKIIYRNAKNIPTCSEEDESCEELVCPDGEEGCEVVTCTDETREEYGIELACTIPDDFAEEEFFEDELGGEEDMLIAEEDSNSSEDAVFEEGEISEEGETSDENTEEMSEESDEPVVQ